MEVVESGALNYARQHVGELWALHETIWSALAVKCDAAGVYTQYGHSGRDSFDLLAHRVGVPPEQLARALLELVSRGHLEVKRTSDSFRLQFKTLSVSGCMS